MGPRRALSGRAPIPTPVGRPTWEFPPADAADDGGLVGLGADLAPATLVAAYRSGIFPWPHEGVDLPWFSPDPRALLPADSIHVSRSLRRTLRQSGWTSTVDLAFGEVVQACGQRRGAEGTWITDGMAHAYSTLNELGWAHSVEIWDEDDLVGGIYGVQVGGVFTGESMFHRRTDASKVAVLDLAQRLADAHGRWLDAQLMTDHLRTLGAIEVPRETFLSEVMAQRDRDVRLARDRQPVGRLAEQR